MNRKIGIIIVVIFPWLILGLRNFTNGCYSFKKRSVTPGFVSITAGSFTMGSPSNEAGRDSNETEHQVTLTYDFEMSESEVTQGQFKSLMGSSSWNPSYFSNCGDDCPVEQVSWYDALAYANKYSQQEGKTVCYTLSNIKCEDGTNVGTDIDGCYNSTQKGIDSATVALNGVSKPQDCSGYRLPTEAEWEYAARAGTTTAFYSGITNYAGYWCTSDPNLDKIGWYCGNASSKTHAVKGKDANSWGLYDMSGNVWE